MKTWIFCAIPKEYAKVDACGVKPVRVEPEEDFRRLYHYRTRRDRRRVEVAVWGYYYGPDGRRHYGGVK